MKKYIYIIIFLLSVNFTFASNVSSVSKHNKSAANEHINFTKKLESQYQTGDSLLNILPINIDKTLAPWGLPSFWFSFVLSAVGTYTLYGIVAAPIAVTVVYLSSNGNWQDTKRAIIGSLLGIAVGGAFKYFMMNI